MRIVQEEDVAGEHMPAPYARVVKHLAAPWTLGTSLIWLGISVIEPRSQSNPHSHESQEEVFFCLSGRGRIRVAEEEAPLVPGTCVFVPQGQVHQLINTASDEVLRVLSATAPAFSHDSWSSVHETARS